MKAVKVLVMTFRAWRESRERARRKYGARGRLCGGAKVQSDGAKVRYDGARVQYDGAKVRYDGARVQ